AAERGSGRDRGGPRRRRRRRGEVRVLQSAVCVHAGTGARARRRRGPRRRGGTAMTLCAPAHFAVDDRAAVARLMHDHPFATLLTTTSLETRISHVPLLFVPACEPH